MEKFDLEAANAEFERFISGMKINEIKLNKLGEEKDSLIELIQYGFLTVMDDGKLKYTLMEPIEGDEGVGLTELNFRIKRIRVEDIEKKMTGKTDMEKARKMMGFMTGTNSALFSKMGSDDFKSCSDIAAFFLPR